MTFPSACWRSYSATGNVLVKDSMRIFHFSSDMLGVGEGIEMMGCVTACISGLVHGGWACVAQEIQEFENREDT